MSKNKKDFFWLSYADLMTSLFFVMLVLFVLVFSIMQYQQNQLQIRLAEYEKIEEIKKAISNLNPKYFKYDPANKRHELKVDVLFRPGKYNIPKDVKADLSKAGQELSEIINKVSVKGNKIKYMVVIEGMAARYINPSELWKNNEPKRIENTYILSYNRAKALYQFWQSRGIEFDEDVFEIVLAGSGWYGAGRYEGEEEGKNKRFLIQIIPKVGEIENINETKI
jgi:outer membrane protein OmpA-like peptidoglycan-associated protein